MLAKDGFLDIEEIKGTPGFTGQEVLSRKKCVVIECVQNIPCNPCEAICPRNAITVGEPITNLPVVDTEKCNGCGMCVANCPGQAIFLVDQSAQDYDTVATPYEYYPLPEKGQDVYCLSRSGRFLTMGETTRTVLTKANDKTAVVEVKVPKGFGVEVRGLSTDKKRMAADASAEKSAVDRIAGINPDDMYVCRCEEVTKAEVIAAVRKGAASINEVKRMLRPGMGLCQGRNCAKTIEQIIAGELNISPAQVPQATKRGPVRPVKLTTYTSLEVEATAEFFEHDW